MSGRVLGISIMTPQAVKDMRENFINFQQAWIDETCEVIAKQIIPPLMQAQLRAIETLLATVEDREAKLAVAEAQVVELTNKLAEGSGGLIIHKGGIVSE